MLYTTIQINFPEVVDAIYQRKTNSSINKLGESILRIYFGKTGFGFVFQENYGQVIGERYLFKGLNSVNVQVFV